MGHKHTGRANEKVDEAVEEARETAIPLYIRRRCTPHQQVVWTAISFLLKAHPRAEFGLREIAQEAGLTSIPRVKGWIDDLVELGVVVRKTPEQSAEGARENFPQMRSKYAIPWRDILRESLKLAEVYVEHHVRGGNRLLPSTSLGSPPGQLSLDLHVSDRSHEGVSDRSHEGVSDRSHEGVSDGIQPCDRSDTKSCIPSDTPGWMDGSIVGMDGSGAPARKKSRQARPGRPPLVPPPPPAEIFAAHPNWAPGGPLPAHPRDLWRAACPTARAVDDEQLASLALEHDEPTGNHGWYWVGRAILAVSLERDARSVAIVRNTMIRWREEDSYGSDRTRSAKEKEIGSERPPRERPARPVATPRRSDGPPPGLKLAGRRNGAPPTPDGGEPV